MAVIVRDDAVLLAVRGRYGPAWDPEPFYYKLHGGIPLGIYARTIKIIELTRKALTGLFTSKLPKIAKEIQRVAEQTRHYNVRVSDICALTTSNKEEYEEEHKLRIEPGVYDVNIWFKIWRVGEGPPFERELFNLLSIRIKFSYSGDEVKWWSGGRDYNPELDTNPVVRIVETLNLLLTELPKV